MGRRRSPRIRMDFDGSIPYITAGLMGVSFFLRAVYYFGFTRPESLGLWNLLIFLILPMLLEASFMVLLRGLQRNAPGIYGIMGAVYCLLLILQSFQYDSVLRMILAIVAYLICGFAVLLAMAGRLNQSLAAAVCFVTAAVRLIVFDLGYYIFGLHLISFMPEAAAVCALAGIAFLPLGLQIGKRA